MPITPDDGPGPTTAERVRTVCARAAAAHVVGDTGEAAAPEPCPVRHLLADGSFAVSVSARSPLATSPAGADVVVELLDRDPHGFGDAVRALVWIRGRVRPLPDRGVWPLVDAIAAADPLPALLDVGHRDTLLHLTVESIVLADAAGAESVDPTAILAARPDPFCHAEAAWIHHLQSGHPEMVERLRMRLPRHDRRGRIRLRGLDRYGLTLTIEAEQGRRDVRVPFPMPVADPPGLSRALRALLACPFSQGLRPRSAG